MFFEKTFEKLMQEKLKEFPNIDTREGSLIYDVMAGNSLEMAQFYIILQEFYKETFGNTASRENLIKRALERGITPKKATHSIFKAKFDIIVEIGSRFNLDKYNFIVVEMISDEEKLFKLQCEFPGSEPNILKGDLIPIEYIQGLGEAKILELIIPGEDEEDTESIRQRYLKSFESQAFGGNIKDYEEKVLSLDGVGAVKVTPVWNGGGTVKLTILDSEFNIAKKELINTVQNIIDPTKDGTGKGLAPIGHIVTVDTPSQESIYIATSITIKNKDITELKPLIDKTLKSYLLELRKRWGNNDIVVRISQIESRILAISEEIIDIKNTKINGYNKNFEIGEYVVPIWGSGYYERD